METLASLYYRPGGYAGVNALYEAAGRSIPKKEIRAWLADQKLAQLHRTTPQKRQNTHFTVTTPNELHQADLLYLPHDGPYKYALNVVDAASRYKASVPIQTKTSEEVAEGFKEIYRTTPLKPPKKLNVDEGTEFRGAVATLMEKLGTTVRRAEPGHHRSQAFVESYNRQLAQRIFKQQYANELVTGRPTNAWVEDLPAFVRAMNSEPTRMTKLKPALAIKQRRVTTADELQLKPVEELLPKGYKVRVRIAADQQEGGRQRATDWRWSEKLHDIDHAEIDPTGRRPVLYFIKGLRHGYTRQDLQLVRRATLPPPTIGRVRGIAMPKQKQRLKTPASTTAQPRHSRSGREIRVPARFLD